MGWRRIFPGRRPRPSMRSYMKRRELLADGAHSPHPRGVQGRLLQARYKRAAGRGRRDRLRGKPLRDRGKRHETKSLLDHLIKPTKERKAALRLRRISR